MGGEGSRVSLPPVKIFQIRFDRKRVVRFLAEIEHCQSNSKFWKQVSLCVFNVVLYFFTIFSFNFEIIIAYAKKFFLPGSICRSLLMNKKQNNQRDLLSNVRTMKPSKLDSL